MDGPQRAGIEWRIDDGAVPYRGRRSPRWRRGSPRSAPAPRRSWSGCWSIRRSIPPGPAPAPTDLVEPLFPVHSTGRGGQFTYHGPGQRVGYVMLDLKRRGLDLRSYVRGLEEWMIRTLAAFNLKGERREGRVGIWIAERGGREARSPRIGVRVRHWVSYHGVSLNLDPDLGHYRGIVPCGISEHGVTSLAAQGVVATLAELDLALKQAFAEVFERLATRGQRGYHRRPALSWPMIRPCFVLLGARARGAARRRGRDARAARRAARRSSCPSPRW